MKKKSTELTTEIITLFKKNEDKYINALKGKVCIVLYRILEFYQFLFYYRLLYIRILFLKYTIL